MSDIMQHLPTLRNSDIFLL